MSSAKWRPSCLGLNVLKQNSILLEISRDCVSMGVIDNKPVRCSALIHYLNQCWQVPWYHHLAYKMAAYLSQTSMCLSVKWKFRLTRRSVATHKSANIQILELEKNWHVTHLLKLVNKMCENKLDPVNIVEETEWAWFHPKQMDRWADVTDEGYRTIQVMTGGCKDLQCEYTRTNFIVVIFYVECTLDEHCSKQGITDRCSCFRAVCVIIGSYHYFYYYFTVLFHHFWPSMS